MKERAGGQDGAPGAGEPQSGRYPALLLHGQPGSARDWDAVVEAIGGRVLVVAIDRPGWDGRSAPGGLEVSARGALEALDRAGIERAVIVGVSFGGAVAAWIAAYRPDRVAGLVLVAPAANEASLLAIDRVLALPVVGYLASSLILSAAGLALSLRIVRDRVAARLSLPDEYLRTMSGRLRERSARRAFWVEQRALLHEVPVLERSLGRIAVETTVILGTSDTIVPPAAARRLSEQIAGARLIEIEGADHALSSRHPQRIADEIVAAAAAGAAVG